MKWHGRWWGIRVIAENDEDNALLWKVIERLPLKAESSYEDGVIRHEPSEDNPMYVQIVFER